MLPAARMSRRSSSRSSSNPLALRTYAAQIKQARNGNYFLVLTEGKRDPETDEVRKTKILVFSEDFKEFFHLLTDAVAFLREHPMPDEIKQKRERFWAKRNGEQKPRAADPKSVRPPPAPMSTRSRLAGQQEPQVTRAS